MFNNNRISICYLHTALEWLLGDTASNLITILNNMFATL